MNGTRTDPRFKTFSSDRAFRRACGSSRVSRAEFGPLEPPFSAPSATTASAISEAPTARSRRIYILENESSVSRLLASPQYVAGTDVVVGVHYLVYVRMRSAPGQHEYRFAEDLLTAADYERLHAAADAAACGWYWCGGRDVSRFEQISYGELVEISFSRRYMVHVLMKHGEIIRKAMDLWRDCAGVTTDFSGRGFNCMAWSDAGAGVFDKAALAASVCRQLQVCHENLRPPLPLPSAMLVAKETAATGSPTGPLRHVIHTAANAWSRVRAPRRAPGARAYLHLCFNNLTLLEYRDGNFVLDSLPRSVLERPRLLVHGWPVAPFDSAHAQLDDGAKAFLSSLTRHCEEVAKRAGALEIFSLNGVSYADWHVAAMRDLTANVIPRLLLYAERTAKTLHEKNIRALLTVDSLSEFAKTELAVCRRDGVRSVFVDHGVDPLKPAMRSSERMLCDVAVTPGTFDRGDRGDLALPLGNPCFDLLLRRPPRNIATIRSVLILGFEDTLYERLDRCAWQEKYYQEAYAAFPRLAQLGVRVLYRPHPANSRAYHDYLLAFFGVPASSFEWATQPTFAELLCEVDLVVSSMSTCWYESLAAAVPAVFFDPMHRADVFFPPIGGRNFEEVICITSGEELVQLVQSERSDPARLREFVTNFRTRHARAYIGPPDGGAGRRISEYVSRLATGEPRT